MTDSADGRLKATTYASPKLCFGPRDLLRWVVANGLGWGVGALVAAEVEFWLVTPVIRDIVWNSTPNTMDWWETNHFGAALLGLFIGFPLFSGLMWIFVGLAQQWVLHSCLGTRPSWVWMSGLGASLGIFLGGFGSALFQDTLNLGYHIAIFAGIALGAALFQWWQGKHLYDLYGLYPITSVWWGIASGVGGALGGLAAGSIEALNKLVDYAFSNVFSYGPKPFPGFMPFVGIAIAGTVYAAVTGVVLWWRVRHAERILSESANQQARSIA